MGGPPGYRTQAERWRQMYPSSGYTSHPGRVPARAYQLTSPGNACCTQIVRASRLPRCLPHAGWYGRARLPWSGPPAVGIEGTPTPHPWDPIHFRVLLPGGGWGTNYACPTQPAYCTHPHCTGYQYPYPTQQCLPYASRAYPSHMGTRYCTYKVLHGGSRMRAVGRGCEG